MDRRRRRAHLLGLAIALGATAALASDAAPPLRAMLWARKDADPVRLFASAPAECLNPAATDDLPVEIGRAAFRTPVLLGGQAARAGLSCESCHRSGRDNPDFLFPGASGEPGTADVTLSLFSSHRGNGVHDPKPIPDLAAPKPKLKVDQAKPGELERFIRGLIVEEFDGREPPAAVLAGLAAYVRALSPGACPAWDDEVVSSRSLMLDVARALHAADGAFAKGDGPTAVLMLAAARARLGLIDERFAGLPRERARIRAADAELASLQTSIRAGRLTESELHAGDVRRAALAIDLAAKEEASLFNPQRLSAAAKRRLPAKSS